MSGAIDDMLDSFDSFEDDLYTELEEILVMSDVGVKTAVEVVEELKKRVASEKIKKTGEVKKELQSIIADMLYGGEDMGLVTLPSVILVLGVNGAGKTTSIGKMAAMYKSQGKKVILGAADTFRAAAIDQLDVWAQRAGVDIIKHKEGADPAAVVFDTIQAGVARDCDIIICDTAGRLHNKKNLMDELNKIYRVVDKELPYADREILLVLDATTGQNGVNQAREFMNVAELTGIILTKLDGTARGGVVLTIKNELKLPVKFIGVGEGIDDLQPFDPAAFAASLFENVQERSETDENSLEDLVNSDDYKNFTPTASDDSGMEAVKALFEQAFGTDDEETEGVSDVEPLEGQKDADAVEAGQTQDEEAEPQTGESDKEDEKAEVEKENIGEVESENFENEVEKTFGEAQSDASEAGGVIGSIDFAETEKDTFSAEPSEETESEETESEEPAAMSNETENTPDITDTVPETDEIAETDENGEITENEANGETTEDDIFVHPYVSAAVSESNGTAQKSESETESEKESTQDSGKEDTKEQSSDREPEKKKRRGLFGLFGRHS